MARFNRFITLLLLATVLMAPALAAEVLNKDESIVPSVLSQDVASPRPGFSEVDDKGIDDEDESETVLPPEPAPQEVGFLEGCVTKMTPKCGKEVYTYMFIDLTVSDACCRMLVGMGEACHNALVQTIFSLPEYKDNASEGISKSKQVWNKCVAIAQGAAAPSPIHIAN